MSEEINIKNKRAGFEYSFLDKFIAGIQLTGTEIKSIRLGKASITEAYCLVEKGEVKVRNMQIEEYDKGGHYNHQPRRDRKLLLNANEIKKISNTLKDQGVAVIPLRLFINEKGLAKLEISLAKGKKIHDKRESIKEREVKRELDRRRKK
ncbi:MAG: SsrA-binding protein SmpB [Bacteroidia bacterium]|nr:SsrA-binding protein SmpB [Bacteroidia bacterium]